MYRNMDSGFGGRGGGTRDLRPGDWICPECKYHNFSSRDICNKCPCPREGGGGGGGRSRRDDWGGGGSRRDDWGGGGSRRDDWGGGGGGGRSRPGDWECSDCRFLNFASRSQCMKCNNKKGD